MRNMSSHGHVKKFPSQAVPANRSVVVQVEAAPRRASLRQRGVQADGAAVDAEGRGGHITLVNGDPTRYNSHPSEPAQPRERHPTGQAPTSCLLLVMRCLSSWLTGASEQAEGHPLSDICHL